MSTIAKIAKNTFYQVGGKLASVVFGLATVAMMTRYLGTTGFGYYTTIITYLQFFSVLIDFGLQMTATQMISKYDEHEKRIFDNIFTLRLISAVIFLGLATGLVWFLPYNQIIKESVWIAGLSFLFISLQSVIVSIFQKKLETGSVALAEIFSRLILLIGTYFAIVMDGGVFYILVATALGSLVNFGYLFIKSKRYFPIHLAFDWPTWRQIWNTSWPLAITIALTLVYFRADTIVMSFTRPQSEVGLYGATYKVLEILVQFPYLFLGLLLPIFTKFFHLNKNLFNMAIQKGMDFFLILITPIIGATLVLGEKVMITLAGPDFAGSGNILRILIFAAGMIYLSALFGYAIVAGDLQKKMIRFYLINAFLSLPLYLIFIPIYSYWAAAIITVATESIMALSSFYIVKKHAGATINFKILGKTTLATLAMCAVLLVMINANLVSLIALGLIIYLMVLYALKGITKEMIQETLKVRNN